MTLDSGPPFLFLIPYQMMDEGFFISTFFYYWKQCLHDAVPEYRTAVAAMDRESVLTLEGSFHIPEDSIP